MMRIAEALVRWNVIVTGVSIALTCAGARLAGVGMRAELLATVACGTFVVYGFDRRAAYSPEDRFRERAISAPPLPVLLAVFLVLAALAWRLHPGGRSILLGLGLVSGLYILPVLPGRRRLKEIPYAKTLLVAFGWAVATTLLPAVDGGLMPDGRLACLVGYRTVFLLPNLLLADWPDRNHDLSAGIRTAANQFEPIAFAQIGRITCFAGLGALLLLRGLHLLPGWALGEATCPICYLMLFSGRLPDSRLFCATVGDILVAWPGLITLFLG